MSPSTGALAPTLMASLPLAMVPSAPTMVEAAEGEEAVDANAPVVPVEELVQPVSPASKMVIELSDEE